jgi:hypothetical protein
MSGSGVLAIWHDIEVGHEADVIEWYNREHHAERVRIDGFRRSRRYISIVGDPQYFIFYETDEPAVLSSPAYLARANNPTPGSRRFIPLFRNNFRTVCKVSWRTGAADGGHVATFRFSPGKGDQNAVRQQMKSYFVGGVLPARGILKAQQWEVDRGGTAIQTGDRELRPARDLHTEWVIVLSAIGPDPLKEVIAGKLGDAAWEKLGAAPGVVSGIYMLEAALEKDHLQPQYVV